MPFNEDINILTGRNGSGKTNVLKLLWYILSGNIHLALREVNFKKATLLTSEYECTVYRLSSNECRVDWTVNDEKTVFEDVMDDEGNEIFCAEDQANDLLSGIGSSIFLPTFRRIEGGFSTEARNRNTVTRARGDIEESLISLSKKLTNGSHIFVSSLSTSDIVTLLVRQYTDLSEEYNQVQQNTSQDIIAKIKDFKKDIVGEDKIAEVANLVFDEIREQIEGMEKSREIIMKPMEAIKAQVSNLFKHSGIKLTKSLSFGDAANAVNSDALSAGEKQMLSFISYNAFYKNAVIIIDEPELSLHVDWQRQLFPILRAQQSSNQFVIATHSPFIYSKYPDKEIQIDADRGDEARN